MASVDEFETRIKRLEEINENLEERVADLELQIAQITERVLHSCTSCGIY
ncbi:MAG TPA: hypothetical protein O0W79_03720 [Methanocorpusculum sp.]|nr:hypothetical protein [Methanocorpusculum sp.]HJJ95670.1 hypothetical protein [Methanocorpusculum sp.]